MKKYLTIDFDIFMYPNIELHNDYDGTADDFLDRFSFLEVVPADLELYKQITQFLLEHKDIIYFMEDHDEIVKLTKGDGPFELINIDHHHDLGYGDDVRWNLPVKEVDEGNWVHKLWDLNRITKYTWVKDYNSIDPPTRANKFLTNKFFIDGYDFNKQLLGIEKIFISYSPSWIPRQYKPLFELWKIIFNDKSKPIEELTIEDIENSEQLTLDLDFLNDL